MGKILISLLFKGNGETDIADGDKPKEHSKDDEDQIAKYRELLRSIHEKEKKSQDTDMEMEIKWIPGRLLFLSL